MNMPMKKIYKVIDQSGRISIPKEVREMLMIEPGDVLEISVKDHHIVIEKIDIVKINDNSLESVRNTVISSAKKLDRKSLLNLASLMVEYAKEEDIDDSTNGK